MTDDLITTEQAAEILSITRRRVQALIKAGRLPAQRLGYAWLIKREDLAAVTIRKPGNHTGRPRTKPTE